jgi:hypothetical protein
MVLPVRRTVQELITRLELEPYEFDVYVEGPSDAALIDWVLRRASRTRYKVFPVDDIDLPSSLFPSDVDPGARDRVVLLSSIVANHFVSRPAPVLCIADRDLDVIFEHNTSSNEFLVFTDDSSFDVLYFDPDVLDRFMSLFVRRRVAEPAAILAALEPVLEYVFLTRAADRALGLSCGALSPARCCNFGGGALIEFDRSDYLDRYLGKSSSLSRRGEVEAMIRQLTPTQYPLRRLIHGHDFVDLLCAILRPYVADKRTVVPAIAARALMTCVDEQVLSRSGCFSRIVGRIPVAP